MKKELPGWLAILIGIVGFYIIFGVIWLIVTGLTSPTVTKWTKEAIAEIQKPPPPKTYILQRAGRDTYTITERP
jgi:hypothetical protein